MNANVFALKRKEYKKVTRLKSNQVSQSQNQKKENEKSDLSLNIDASVNLPINNLNKTNKIIEQKETIKTSDYPRPITNKKPNKSKILHFINSVLSNTNDKNDEVPIYINLLTKAKNKVKNSKEKNKQITPSIYNSNLGKDKY